MLARGRDRLRRLHRAGRLLGALHRLLQHHGHGHDHELAGRGAGHAAAGLGGDPGALSRRGQEMAYRTGKRIVEMVHEDLKPSDILTRDAFLNAIVVNSAIGGSTNAPIHLDGHRAPHRASSSTLDDWQTVRPRGAAAGQPAAGRRISGRGLLPRRRRAGGGQRADEAGPDPREGADRQRQDASARIAADAPIEDEEVIRPSTSR